MVVRTMVLAYPHSMNGFSSHQPGLSICHAPHVHVKDVGT